jgi:hypothetical protein
MKKEYTVHPWNDLRKAWIVRTSQGTSCCTVKSSKAEAQRIADGLNETWEREKKRVRKENRCR